MTESAITDLERKLTNQVADLKRQLGAEREGRMRAETLLDDTRRANESLRAEITSKSTICVECGDVVTTASTLCAREDCPARASKA